jgi:hypothetical protein
MEEKMDSRKSMRHFYCRDVLWTTFEQMATDFGVSVDYLIGESMRHYAKNKGYAAGDQEPQASPAGANPPTAEFQVIVANVPAKQPPPLPSQTGSKRNSGSFRLGSSDFFGETTEESPLLTLYIVYDGEKIPIDKDQFILGRAKNMCDLAIKDTNISRKHAAVFKKDNKFYIKDLGSTNGIIYKGMKIDNKRIDEGDVFYMCENEVTFTYK